MRCIYILYNTIYVTIYILLLIMDVYMIYRYTLNIYTTKIGIASGSGKGSDKKISGDRDRCPSLYSCIYAMY